MPSYFSLLCFRIFLKYSIMKNEFCFEKFKKIRPEKLDKELTISELIEKSFFAYNAARLKDACRIFVEKMLLNDGVIGMSLAGALTPAGLGISCVIPLIEHGFVDWITSTGANLYHDMHFGIGKNLFQGSPFIDDTELRKKGVIRIYDILFEYDVLLSTDKFICEIIKNKEFQTEMGTPEFHHLLGKYVKEREKILNIQTGTILSKAYEYDVPVFTSSPGDSSIGMNVAAMELAGNGLKINPSSDVNFSTSIVLHAKRKYNTSGIFIVGGGSPKNFMLQTEPHLQEVLGITESGHDYFIQITDARPDTGGLSGATPSEAVSWGKVRPDQLPDTCVLYLDATVALPLITNYVLCKAPKREPKRLLKKKDELLLALKKEMKNSTLSQEK